MRLLSEGVSKGSLHRISERFSHAVESCTNLVEKLS